MFLPILVIVSLAVGSVNLCKRIESPESKAEREAYHQQLAAGDPETVAQFLKQEQHTRERLALASGDIESFQKIPIQPE